ncbi:MAG TPA: exopolysaccharide biosynthesis polyprenyl glycosylphosphotransferase [Acetobacteraceae bacterium]|nr:exopolysaccharide biosynthesis polyprenyl glycosylphosphotransferase [Acetobacteraceae bacterium]
MLRSHTDGALRSTLSYYPLLCTAALVGADCLAVLAASGAALRFGSVLSAANVSPIPTLPPSGVWRPAADLLALSASLLVCLAARGRYSDRIPFWSDVRHIVCACSWAAAILVIFSLLTGEITRCASAALGLLFFAPFAMVGNRAAKQALAWAGIWGLRVVVLGDGPSAAQAEAAVTSDPSLGYDIVGRIDPAAITVGAAVPRLWPVLARYRASRLLIALDSDGTVQRQVIGAALRERVPFAIVPQPYAFPSFAFDSTRIFTHEPVLLAFRDGLSRPVSRFLKAAVDIVGATVALIVASPLFLAIAVAVRLDGGPVLFAHQRVGAGGRHFYCLKFRTMVADADRVLEDALANDPALAVEWQATRKLRNDPRITPVGRFLRKTSLDELPQLINVIRLDMSLVGPRPIVDSEIPLYGDDIAQYYAARPGLTGLWQVSGRSDTTYARRVQLDVWYVNNWTIWHDVAVLLKTIPVVLGRVGAR